GDLLGRATARRDDRGSTRHRLEHRNAESLVQRRVDDAERTAVLTRELGVVYLSEPRDVRAVGCNASPTARTDNPELDTGEGRSLDCKRKVLSRLERADAQDVVTLGPRAAGRERGIDTVRHDAYLLARHA